MLIARAIQDVAEAGRSGRPRPDPGRGLDPTLLSGRISPPNHPAPSTHEQLHRDISATPFTRVNAARFRSTVGGRPRGADLFVESLCLLQRQVGKAPTGLCSCSLEVLRLILPTTSAVGAGPALPGVWPLPVCFCCELIGSGKDLNSNVTSTEAGRSVKGADRRSGPLLLCSNTGLFHRVNLRMALEKKTQREIIRLFNSSDLPLR
jgi:hypothetical protein